jgi:predicted ABC-type transport system involved in lysophospholipase L1 biosynthesis ATPase subunit
MMPGLIRGESFGTMRPQAVRLLEEVGLGHRIAHPVGKLSGGERQRVAVARALVLEPALLLADEPTGNLDPKTGDQVLDLLLEINRTHGTALVVVTHSPALARTLGRQAVLEDGHLTEPIPFNGVGLSG